MVTDVKFNVWTFILPIMVVWIRTGIDYVQIEIKKEYIGRRGYIERWFLTAATLAILAFMDWLQWGPEHYWQSVCLYFAFFWLLFDDCLNLVRKYPLGYTGADKRDMSFWEGVYQKIPPIMLLTLKVGVAVVSVLLYYFLDYV